MDEKLKEWTIAKNIVKEELKIDSMVIPCLVLLVIMLILIATLQHNLVEEYQEAVETLDESN